jgi:hypothetical protein
VLLTVITSTNIRQFQENLSGGQTRNCSFYHQLWLMVAPDIFRG